MESLPGQGSTFCFSLPLSEAAAELDSFAYDHDWGSSPHH